MRVCGRVFQCAKLINLYGITKKSTLLIQLSFLKLRILTRIVTEHHGFLFLICRFNGISQFSQDYIWSVRLRGYPCEKTRHPCEKAHRNGRSIFRLMCLCVRPLTCAASWVAYTSKPYFFSFSSSNLSVSESWWQMSVSKTLLPAL